MIVGMNGYVIATAAGEGDFPLPAECVRLYCGA